MRITRLTVQNIRAHDTKTLDFVTNPTLITGANGSGKTSLIEAIYIALRGKSFRGSDLAICHYGTDFYRIVLETDIFTYRVQYGMVGTRKARQFIIDDKKYARLPYKLKYPIVLFEPEDLRIINGSPQRRRQLVDTLIQQYDPHYGSQLSRYERALQQRNKLLKDSSVTRDVLFPWNVLLSDYGAAIIAKRQAVAAIFHERITALYRQIAHNDDSVSIAYSHNDTATSQQLLRQYEEKFDYDRVAGATSVGPHRHDIHIIFNRVPAAQAASRGECRTIVLAMKFIEAEYIEQQSGVPPIILLDDVFGELDEQRQRALLAEFKANQVVMTSTVDIR